MTIIAHYAHKAADLKPLIQLGNYELPLTRQEKSNVHESAKAVSAIPAADEHLKIKQESPDQLTELSIAAVPVISRLSDSAATDNGDKNFKKTLPAPWVHRAGIHEYEKASRSYELAYERNGSMFSESEVAIFEDTGAEDLLSMKEWLVAREMTILRNNSFTNVAIARKVNSTEEQNALLLEKRIQSAETQREMLKAVQLSALRQSRMESHARDLQHSEQTANLSTAIIEMAPDMPQARNDQRIRQPVMIVSSDSAVPISPHPISCENWKQAVRLTPSSTTIKPVKLIVNAYRVFAKTEV